MRRCHLKIFFYFKLWWPFCSAEQKHFSSFGKGSPKKHFYEIILKSGHWSRRKCHLKIFFLFLDLAAILLGAMKPSRTFGRGSPKEHFCEIILKSVFWPARLCRFKVFLFLLLVTILFSRVKHFLQFM